MEHLSLEKRIQANKMAKITSFLVLFIFSIYYFQGSSALTCYKCSSPQGLNLPCDINPSEVETCTADQTECVSYVWGGSFRPIGILSRGCASGGHCDALVLQQSGIFNTLTSCKACETDLCNSA